MLQLVSRCQSRPVEHTRGFLVVVPSVVPLFLSSFFLSFPGPLPDRTPRPRGLHNSAINYRAVMTDSINYCAILRPGPLGIVFFELACCSISSSSSSFLLLFLSFKFESIFFFLIDSCRFMAGNVW